MYRINGIILGGIVGMGSKNLTFCLTAAVSLDKFIYLDFSTPSNCQFSKSMVNVPVVSNVLPAPQTNLDHP